MIRPIVIALLALATCASAQAGGAGFLDKPKAESQFLPVDQAFEIQPLERKNGNLLVSWRIAPGYYLYRQRLSFELLTPKSAKSGKPALPRGEKHSDEYMGEVEIYHLPMLVAKVPLEAKTPKAIKVKVGYQGCADAGLCYPPQERVLELTP